MRVNSTIRQVQVQVQREAPEEGVILMMKAVRLQRGWSQQDLAFFVRMAAADICRIETGRMIPYPSQAVRLAQVLAIKPEDLLQEVANAEMAGIS
jgi:ribosome-binding protein aMBF1 (putative translation factor)